MAEWYWHVHHNELCEPLTEPLENRIAHIRKNKPQGEIKTRLRLMRLVTDPLPLQLLEAHEACREAYNSRQEAYTAYWKVCNSYPGGGKACMAAEVAYEVASIAYSKSQTKYRKLYRAFLPELETLHELSCLDCPWNGHTIFPRLQEGKG